MAVTQANIRFVDHSKEMTTVSFNLGAILADGSNYDTLVSDVASHLALSKAAIDAITGLNHVATMVSVPKIYEDTPITYPAYGHDREIAVRFTMQDNVTGKLYRFDIADPVDIFNTDSDDVDMADALVVALKAIVDGDWKSEMGNAVTLISGKKVGRRN
jgi:RAB protein geranylgeranyltransferase component A